MTITFLEFLRNLINLPFFVMTALISAVMFVNGCVDTPNSVATCVSTRCITPKKALFLSAFFTSLGIILMTFLSSSVAQTVFNIVDFGANAKEAMIAFLAALIAIVMWSFLTWMFGIPSSQSHSLLAGITGAAIAVKGDFSAVNLGEWKKVLCGLIFINLLVFALGFAITKIIEMICKNKDRRKTNKFFKSTQIISASLMAFMNGAQDGQKFMGLFLLGAALSTGVMNSSNLSIPIWLIIYCSILIATGCILGGMRVIKLVGTKVSKLEKYQGTAVDLSNAICLFISSVSGIPVSTTHTKSCAIMGVGASKRLSNVNWNVVKNMIKAWIFTFPGCGILGYLLTLLFINIF